jgi:histidine triad (HIT) family protein
MTPEDSCIFCRIVQRKAPASIIYEDEKAMVFLDIRPLNQGHALVIPKEHYETIFDIPEDVNAHLHRIVKKTSVAVKEAVVADGITIIQQNGRAAGQEVFHLHVHVVPRYEGQKLPRFTEIPNASREQLEQTAELIKKQLNR